MTVRYGTFVLLALFFLTGCGSGDTTKTTEVSGMVQMDGAPLAEGDIFFEDVGQAVSPVSVKITNGVYAAKLPPGEKIVRISAMKPGKPDPLMGAGPPQPIIAKEFNTNSTLKHKVEATAQKNVNFEVKGIGTK